MKSMFRRAKKRVHDRVLAMKVFVPASDGTEVELEDGELFHSFLEKRGGSSVLTHYKWRWFVLTPTALDYYVPLAMAEAAARGESDSVKPKGSLSLVDGFAVQVLDAAPPNTPTTNVAPTAVYFEIHTPHRSLLFRARDSELRELWLDRLELLRAQLPEYTPPVPESDPNTQTAESLSSKMRRWRTKMGAKLNSAGGGGGGGPSLGSNGDDGEPLPSNLFGVDLQTLMADLPEDMVLPGFLRSTIEHIRAHSLDLDGVFRISGNQRMLDDFVVALNATDAATCDVGTFPIVFQDPHLVSAALKLWLRALPEPLFTFALYDAFVAAAKIRDHNARLEELFFVIADLPDSNYLVTKALMEFLVEVAAHESSNRMGVSNLAVVIAPNLLRPKVDSMATLLDLQYQSQAVELCIEYADYLFQPAPE